MILEKLDSHMQINEVRTHLHIIYKNKLNMPLTLTTLMAESEEELKSLLMKVKVESEKVGLKLNI